MTEKEKPEYSDIHRLKTFLSHLSHPLDEIPANENLNTEKTETSATIFNELVSDKKSVEEMKIPEFESENHKIDFGLTAEEKKSLKINETINGVTKEERPALVNWIQTKINVLKKELAPGAYVWEYIDDGNMPEYLIGEQLFNWKAIANLWLENRLPTYEQCQEMGFSPKWWEKHIEAMNKYFKEWDNYIFPWARYPEYQNFYSIGTRADMRLAWKSDWINATFNNNYIHLNLDADKNPASYPEFWFGLRLLKK